MNMHGIAASAHFDRLDCANWLTFPGKSPDFNAQISDFSWPGLEIKRQ